MFGTETKQKPELDASPEWLTLPEMAAAFGVTPQGFAKTVRPLIPDDEIKSAGKHGAVRIRCRAAIDAWVNHKLEQQKAAMRGSADDAMIYAGGDSPNLERVRLATAQLKEMELEERRKTHASLASIHTGLMRFAGAFRRVGEVLQRKFGGDAADVVNEAIDTAEKEVNEFIDAATKP